MLTIGVLRETRIPPDSRVAITPMMCVELARQFGIRFLVQPSPFRIFKDEEYANFGIEIKEDLSECDVLFGVKEVQPETLLPKKTYFFFSHTTKKQPHNRKLLQTVCEKGITLIDYEEITDVQKKRLVAFGHFAGLVGAYNAFLHYGKREKLFDLKPAYQCYDFKEMVEEMKKIVLPPIKIVLTGGGRVGSSAKEILQKANLTEVSPKELLNSTFSYPVFCQLKSEDYFTRKDGKPWDTHHFHSHPTEYVSDFLKYTSVADILVAGAFWNPHSPRLFSKEDMLSPNFKIKLVADITCDINGSIPSTIKASSIPEPVYDFDPNTGQAKPAYSNYKHVTVMAVDNLPCELPRDASESFARQLSQHVFYNLVEKDEDLILNQATIVKKGKLTIKYAYLSDFVQV
jgi:saccharopine dehydrogenase (NAD+, L-lysine forming)